MTVEEIAQAAARAVVKRLEGSREFEATVYALGAQDRAALIDDLAAGIQEVLLDAATPRPATTG